MGILGSILKISVSALKHTSSNDFQSQAHPAHSMIFCHRDEHIKPNFDFHIPLSPLLVIITTFWFGLPCVCVCSCVCVLARARVNCFKGISVSIHYLL